MQHQRQKKEELEVIYSDEDKKKKKLKSGTMGRKEAASLLADEPDVGAGAKPYSRKEEAERERAERLNRQTWAPQSAAKLEDMFSSLTTQSSSSPALDVALQPSQQGRPRPGPQVVRVRAKWAFTPDRAGELSMQVNDVLTILDQSNPNWWQAELNGSKGIIPSNYVEVIQEEPELPDLPPPIPPLPQEDTSIPAPPSGGPAGAGRGLGGQFMPPVDAGRGRGRGRGGPVVSGPQQGPASTPISTPVTPAPAAVAGAAPSLSATGRGRGAGSPASFNFVPPVGGFGGGGPAASPPSSVTLPETPLPDLPPPEVDEHSRLPDLPPEAWPNLPPSLPVLPVQLPNLPPPAFSAPAEEQPLPPVPPPQEEEVWEQYYTDEGHLYYYNPKTQQSKWG